MARKRKLRIALPPHVNIVRAKGREYFYYQPFRGTKRAGKSVRIPGLPTSIDGTPNAEWWACYRQLAGEPEPRPGRGTFAALIEAFQQSPEWQSLAPKTRKEWTRHLALVESVWGALQVAGIETKHVVALRDRRAATPADANNLIGATSSLIAWSVLRGWRRDNPCRGVPRLKTGPGYAPWSWKRIVEFEEAAPPHLWHAAALALYSGQRLSDVLKMKWSDISENLLQVTQSKTGKQLWLPLHNHLSSILGTMSRDSIFILTNSRGRPWTSDGLKSSWSSYMNTPEMKSFRAEKLVFHGLRKSAVVMLLEAGATIPEVASVTGQSYSMVSHYAKQVSQRRLAASAILKWQDAGPHSEQK